MWLAIVQERIISKSKKLFHEDKWIYRLETQDQLSLNRELNDYEKKGTAVTKLWSASANKVWLK